MSEAQTSNVTDHAHAKLSASGSERWSLCAGSLAMEDGRPDDSSEYGDEGTAAHELAALTFRDPERRAHAFLGRYIQVLNKDGSFRRGFTVTPEMADAVQTYVNNVLKSVGGNEVFVEQKVPISHITDEAGATGTADATALVGSELQVHDLKFGQGVRVEAEGNTQLLMYADGTLENYITYVGSADDIKTVRMVIHQPRLGAVNEWVIPVSEMRERIAKLRKAADLATTALTFKANWIGKDESYLVPDENGEGQCRWCKAKAVCPARARQIAAVIGADFSAIVDAGAGRLNPTEATPAADLSQKMLAVDYIEVWCQAVRAEVERRLIAGDEVPEYKLVQGKRGNRKWNDEVEAETTLKAMRLKTEEIYRMTVNTPPVIETLLKKAHPRQWAKLLPMIGQADGQPHVAHVSDKRPAISLAPTAEDFAPIPEGADAGDAGSLADLT